jgi:hypothetical protein
LNDTKINRRYD